MSGWFPPDHYPEGWKVGDPPPEYLRENDVLRTRLREALEVVAFYGDPDSYFAIAIWPDRPAGNFADDFSDVDSLGYFYERDMPGKKARELLAAEWTHEFLETEVNDEQQ
jgi:hypothetical protein